MAEYPIEGKNFVVTGGASGIGALLVEKFLGSGAKHVLFLDIAVEVGKAFEERLNKAHPGKVTFIKCDISKEDEIVRAFNESVDKLKQIDVLINNAGIMSDAPNMWRTACDVNWQGLVSFTLKGINHMSKAEGGAGGTIINTASEVALKKVAPLPIYSGFKSAVLHFCQNIAMDPFYSETGIRLLVICYGATDTPLLHNLGKKAYDPKLGNLLSNLVDNVITQTASSAVNAFMMMYRKGAPGSIWYAANDKEGRDITNIVNEAFDSFQKNILEA